MKNVIFKMISQFSCVGTAVCFVIFWSSSAIASTVDMYQIKITGTIQQGVAGPNGSLVTDNKWRPFVGDEIEFIFEMPLTTLPTSGESSGSKYSRYGGTGRLTSNGVALANPIGSNYATLQTNDNPTNNRVLVQGYLDRNAFGSLGFDRNIDVFALLYDLDNTGVIDGLPTTGLFPEFETQYLGLRGVDERSFGRSDIVSEAFVSIDAITVVGAPSPVPLPASVFLLGAGLAGLGVMRRRSKTAP